MTEETSRKEFVECKTISRINFADLISCPFLLKEFLDIQATIECGFTLKCVCDMIETYSQVYLGFVRLLASDFFFKCDSIAFTL